MMRLNSSSAAYAAHTGPSSDLLALSYWDTLGPLEHRTALVSTPPRCKTRSNTGQSGFSKSG